MLYGFTVHWAVRVASPAPHWKVELPVVDEVSVPVEPAVLDQPLNVYPVFCGAVIVTFEP